jgi:TldD protein
MFESINVRRVLAKALSGRGMFADLFAEETLTTTIELEQGKVEKISSGIRRGAGVRLIHDFRTAYAYTNSLQENSLLELARVVAQAAKGRRKMKGKGERGENRENREKAADPVSIAVPLISPIEIPPDSIPLKEKVARLWQAEAAARKLDRRVRQVLVIYRDGRRKISVANSEGLMASDQNTHTLFVVRVVAEQDGKIQAGMETHGGTMGFEIFSARSPEEIALKAARRAVLMLDARKAPGGRMSVVLSSEAGGTMIHEAIGHGLEADLAGEGLSVYTGRLGQVVASPLISVADDATLPNRRGSFGMDDEGTPARRTLLVEKGVLKGYMYDRVTAMKMKSVSTGNGRRESYEYKPIVRMTNTMILPGETDPKEILKATDKGLFVKKMGGGQVNTVNGDFVFEIDEGYLIERGKVAEPVRGATLVGNGPEVLKAIDMVGNDLGFGIGTCGKDGQGVPVADAQPTLRIPEITVGGEIS